MEIAPTKPNHRVPNLSANWPHITPNAADENEATVYAKEVWPLVHPNSRETGFKNTEIDAIDPKASPLKTKTTRTITHP